MGSPSVSSTIIFPNSVQLILNVDERKVTLHERVACSQYPFQPGSMFLLNCLKDIVYPDAEDSIHRRWDLQVGHVYTAHGPTYGGWNCTAQEENQGQDIHSKDGILSGVPIELSDSIGSRNIRPGSVPSAFPKETDILSKGSSVMLIIGHVIVAKGTIHTNLSTDTCHGEVLGKGRMSVEVTEVLRKNVALPYPSTELSTVGDALQSFVVWDLCQAILYEDICSKSQICGLPPNTFGGEVPPNTNIPELPPDVFGRAPSPTSDEKYKSAYRALLSCQGRGKGRLCLMNWGDVNVKKVDYLPPSMDGNIIFEIPSLPLEESSRKGFLAGMDRKEMPQVWTKSNTISTTHMEDPDQWMIYESKCVGALECDNLACRYYKDHGHPNETLWQASASTKVFPPMRCVPPDTHLCEICKSPPMCTRSCPALLFWVVPKPRTGNDSGSRVLVHLGRHSHPLAIVPDRQALDEARKVVKEVAARVGFRKPARILHETAGEMLRRSRKEGVLTYNGVDPISPEREFKAWEVLSPIANQDSVKKMIRSISRGPNIAGDSHTAEASAIMSLNVGLGYSYIQRTQFIDQGGKHTIPHIFKMSTTGPGSGVDILDQMHPGGKLFGCWICFDNIDRIDSGWLTMGVHIYDYNEQRVKTICICELRGEAGEHMKICWEAMIEVYEETTGKRMPEIAGFMCDAAQAGINSIQDVFWNGVRRDDKLRLCEFHWKQARLVLMNKYVKEHSKPEFLRRTEEWLQCDSFADSYKKCDELMDWLHLGNAKEEHFNKIRDHIRFWQVRFRLWGHYVRKGLSLDEDAKMPVTNTSEMVNSKWRAGMPSKRISVFEACQQDLTLAVLQSAISDAFNQTGKIGTGPSLVDFKLRHAERSNDPVKFTRATNEALQCTPMFTKSRSLGGDIKTKAVKVPTSKPIVGFEEKASWRHDKEIRTFQNVRHFGEKLKRKYQKFIPSQNASMLDRSSNLKPLRIPVRPVVGFSLETSSASIPVEIQRQCSPPHSKKNPMRGVGSSQAGTYVFVPKGSTICISGSVSHSVMLLSDSPSSSSRFVSRKRREKEYLTSSDADCEIISPTMGKKVKAPLKTGMIPPPVLQLPLLQFGIIVEFHDVHPSEWCLSRLQQSSKCLCNAMFDAETRKEKFTDFCKARIGLKGRRLKLVPSFFAVETSDYNRMATRGGGGKRFWYCPDLTCVTSPRKPKIVGGPVQVPIVWKILTGIVPPVCQDDIDDLTKAGFRVVPLDPDEGPSHLPNVIPSNRDPMWNPPVPSGTPQFHVDCPRPLINVDNYPEYVNMYEPNIVPTSRNGRNVVRRRQKISKVKQDKMHRSQTPGLKVRGTAPVRSGKGTGLVFGVESGNNLYAVHICAFPNCSCPDFMGREEQRTAYIACKHIYYIYLSILRLSREDVVIHAATLSHSEVTRMLASQR